MSLCIWHPQLHEDHLLFFESKNQQRSLKGIICAIMRSPLTFVKLKPRPLSKTYCLGLVDGLFFGDGILKLVMHIFEMTGSKTLSQLISNYGCDMQEFAKHVFISEPIVVNELQISLLPLCQIHGPKMTGWGLIIAYPAKRMVISFSVAYNPIDGLLVISTETRPLGYPSLKRLKCSGSRNTNRLGNQ